MIHNSYRLLSCICIAFFPAFNHAKEPPWESASFSAVRVEFNQTYPQQMIESQMNISHIGIRGESLSHSYGESPHLIAIVNLKKNKSWLLSPKGKKYTVLRGGSQEQETDEALAGGILTNTPCRGFAKSEIQGREAFLGRETERWICKENENGKHVIQLYDPQLNTVIREESADGGIVELRDIKEGKQPESLYLPPQDYRKVSIKAFFTGVPDFPRYENKKEVVVPDELLPKPTELPGYNDSNGASQ